MKYTVFVYGSLMKGNTNNSLLSDATYLTDAVSCDFYQFISFGAYPALRLSPEHDNLWRVVGELYQCDDETMRTLDRLESNGHLYQRRERPIRLANGGTMTAWVYEYLRESWGSSSEPGRSKDFVTQDDVAFWNGGHWAWEDRW